MHLSFEETKEEILAVQRVTKHVSPHLHSALEIVWVTDGTLELGVGQDLYHMEKGDIGFVFPNVIHHYQVFSDTSSTAVFIKSLLSISDHFETMLTKYAPEYPIIKSPDVEEEVYRTLKAILDTKQTDMAIVQAYLQIVLARCSKKFRLVEKRDVGSSDLIYQTVAYMSGNFKKQFSLENMARELGVNKYMLSRIFSKTFHTNFNQYLNDVRLNYACHRLENTGDSITNIYLDSGFDSQRTFNRVFKDRFKISPSEYRRNHWRECSLPHHSTLCEGRCRERNG